MNRMNPQIQTDQCYQEHRKLHEEFLKKFDDISSMQWIATRKTDELSKHIDTQLAQLSSDRFQKIFGVSPKKNARDITVSPFGWPQNQAKPHTINFFLSCLQAMQVEKEFLFCLESEVKAFEEFAKSYKEITTPLTLSEIQKKTTSVESSATILKFFTLKEELLSEKKVTKFYIVPGAAEMKELHEYSMLQDSLGVFARYILSLETFARQYKEIAKYTEGILTTFGKQEFQYNDLLIPLLSCEVILHLDMLKKTFSNLKQGVGGQFINPCAPYYKTSKAALELFKRNQKSQNELYQLIYEVFDKIILTIPERSVRFSTSQKVSTTCPKILYIDEKLEKQKIHEEKKKLQQIEKNRNELLGDPKKSAPKSNKKPIPKSNSSFNEKIDEIEQFQEKPHVKPIFTEKKSTEKVYEFFSEPPIKNYTNNVLRWQSLKPGEQLQFKDYSQLSEANQLKAQYLHDFSYLVDHFAFDPNFAYVEGDCHHLFVAYEFEDGTIDTGVTTYHFTDSNHTECNHRFHSRLSPFELATKGFSEIMDKIFKESLEDTDFKENISFNKNQREDKCWINEKHGYITILDKKYGMKIHIYRKIAS